MKFIAHRGLFQGPDKDKENNPDQICEALEKGFDVEIDLRCDENNNLFLGHDYNQYPILMVNRTPPTFKWLRHSNDPFV